MTKTSKFKTKLLAVFFAAAMMLTSVNVTAFAESAAEAFTSDGYADYVKAASAPDVVASGYSESGYYIAESYSDIDAGKEPTLTPTAANQAAVKAAMLAMKSSYPEGKSWTNSDKYVWNNIYIPSGSTTPVGTYTGGGCVGFAMILSDAAFGTDVYAYEKKPIDFDKIYIGDILRINSDTHSVIVIDKDSTGVTIAEGNYNYSVHWGRTLTKAQVQAADYYITRYAEGSADGSIAIDEQKFPDADFRSYVAANIDGIDGSTKDGKLSAEEIAATGTINASGYNIDTLKGIELFTALKKLNCSNNNLSSLDISALTELQELVCSYNKITSLNLSGNRSLQNLTCSNNYLETLNLSYNKALTYLDCSYNTGLYGLNLSNGDNLATLICNNCNLSLLYLDNCPKLQSLECQNSHIERLDLTKNKKLTIIYCDGNCITSLNLNNIESSTVNLSAANNIITVKIPAGTATFDMETLPGYFDATKMSNLKNASASLSGSEIYNSEGLAGKTVSYNYDVGKDYVITFKIKFEALAVKSVAWKTQPKGTFYQGTSAATLFKDCTLTVTYDDNSTAVVPVTESMVSGYDPSKATRQTVTVTYGGKSVSYAVQLTALKATKLEISKTDPPPMSFFVGEDFDVGSGELYIELNSGKKGNIEMDADTIVLIDISKYDKTKVGKYKINVTVFGKTISYEVEVRLNPSDAPVVLHYGTEDEAFANLTEAFKRITALKKPEVPYTVTVRKEITDGTLNFPKVDDLTILATGTGMVKTTATTLTLGGNTTIGAPNEGVQFVHVDTKGNPDGKSIGIKAAANSKLTINGFLSWGDITGMATSELEMQGGPVNNLSTFKKVYLQSQVEVAGKVSGIALLESGSLLISDAKKGSVAITAVDYGFISLRSETGSKGKLIFPKVTVSDITSQLTLKVVDIIDTVITLPSGTSVMTVGAKGNNANIKKNLKIENKTSADNNLDPFIYKTDVRAEYANAIYLNDEPYPNFEQVFMNLNESGNNIIELNEDVAPDKFALPTKAGTLITITSKTAVKRTLTLPKTVTTISSACPLNLYNVNITSAATRLTISGKKGVTINDCNITPIPSVSVGADSTLGIYGSRMAFDKLSGTKTSTLDIGYYTDVNEVATFGTVNISSGDVLSVTGKVSGIEKLNGGADGTGTLRMLGAEKTNTAVIKEVGKATLALDYKDGAVTKATVTTVSDTLILKLYKDWSDTIAVLPFGTAVLTAGGTEDFTGKIVIENKDSASHDLGAFMYKKEIRAEYAGLLTLKYYDGTTADRNFPNFETLFAHIDAREAQLKKDKQDPQKYRVVVNANVAAGKLALPKSAAALAIQGKDGTQKITMTATATLSAKYDVNLSKITVENTDTKGNAAKFTINHSAGLLNLSSFESDTLTGITGGANAKLVINGYTLPKLEKISGFGECNVYDDFTTCKTFSIGTLTFKAGKTITIAKDSKVTIKDIVNSYNDSTIYFAEGTTPNTIGGSLTISGSVTGTKKIKLKTDFNVPETLQIFTAQKCDLGMFEAHLWPTVLGGNPTLTRTAGKVYCKDAKLEFNDTCYVTFADIYSMIEAKNDNTAIYDITMLGDYDCGGAMKFPRAGTYKALRYNGGGYTLMFTGNLTLTGSIEFKNIKLHAKDTKGSSAKYTITTAKNCSFMISNATINQCTEIKGTNSYVYVSDTGALCPVKITADSFVFSDLAFIIDTLNVNTLYAFSSGQVLHLLNKKQQQNKINKGISDDSDKFQILMVDETDHEVNLKTGHVIFAVFKGDNFKKMDIANDFCELKLDTKTNKVTVVYDCIM